MSAILRAGYVGAGFAARFHHASLQQAAMPGIEVVGVHSKRQESREGFAVERGLSAFDSLEVLLDAVDVIHVCTPPSVHEAITIEALKRDKHVIIEKPLTGYFGPPGDRDFRGNSFDKEAMYREAMASATRMVEAEKASRARIYYAENWIFAPVIQKEADIIEKTGAQLLWIIAEESHSGSHSPLYGIWEHSGGGSLMGKGTHPLTTVLYLKRAEGLARDGKPIRPKGVSSRVHQITRIPGYEDRGFLRTDYHDVEDYGIMHVVFEDGTVADVFASELVMGGVHNWLEVYANNHRTRCNINPTDGLQTYNPSEEQFKDVYVVEKIGTKQGWSNPAADENWSQGYVQEISHFYGCIQEGSEPLSGSGLGYDTVAVVYASYLSEERAGAEVPVV